jgi:hypothetical protein
MPVVIQAYYGNHQMRSVEPAIDANHQVVRITGVMQNPSMVLFDPNNNILRKLTYAKSIAQLAYQATYAKHVGDRLWALDQLTKVKKTQLAAAKRAIRSMAYFDPFYGVRADAVADAAKLGDWQTLRGALQDKDPRVVIAALRAATMLPKGSYPDLAGQVKGFVGNRNPLIASAALAAVGSLKPAGAYPMLVAALSRQSWRQQVASGALQGLANYGDMRAFGLLEARTAYGTPELERSAAIAAMTKLVVGAKQPALVESRLLNLAQHDPLISTRIAAVAALGKLGQPSAIPVLERIEFHDTQQAVQSGAWNAILDIEDAVNLRHYHAQLRAYRAARR